MFNKQRAELARVREAYGACEAENRKMCVKLAELRVDWTKVNNENEALRKERDKALADAKDYEFGFRLYFRLTNVLTTALERVK